MKTKDLILALLKQDHDQELEVYAGISIRMTAGDGTAFSLDAAWPVREVSVSHGRLCLGTAAPEPVAASEEELNQGG